MTQIPYELAAKHGHLDIIKWLHETGVPFDDAAWREAAINGHIHILEYLREAGAPYTLVAYTAAARNGRLDVLKWLYSLGYSYDAVVCMNAARDYPEVLAWVRENIDPDRERKPSTLDIFADVRERLRGDTYGITMIAAIYAASVGHLEGLSMICNSCPRYNLQADVIYDCAAKHGHLHIIQWLKRENCPVPDGLRAVAVARGHKEIVQWLDEQS